MAMHSSGAWRIPWPEAPGRLQSVESQSWTRLSDFPFHDAHLTSSELIKTATTLFSNKVTF